MIMPVAQSGFIHRFLPSPKMEGAATLLLLHGTGGDENDLLDIGRLLAPEANLLSPRGRVLENGMPRFFRRVAEGVFDLQDLKIRTRELAEFTEKSATVHGFELDRIIAVGYSNGANIAASLLLLFPRLLAGAILFRPMVPLEPDSLPDLSDVMVFIASGRHDMIIPPEQPERLTTILQAAGADVTLRWQDAGHGITSDEIKAGREWLTASVKNDHAESNT